VQVAIPQPCEFITKLLFREAGVKLALQWNFTERAVTQADFQASPEIARVCEKCGALMVHLGVIRHFLKRSTTVFRCYHCDNVVVERG
jgi:hypothetical protein